MKNTKQKRHSYSSLIYALIGVLFVMFQASRIFNIEYIGNANNAASYALVYVVALLLIPLFLYVIVYLPTKFITEINFTFHISFRVDLPLYQANLSTKNIYNFKLRQSYLQVYRCWFSVILVT